MHIDAVNLADGDYELIPSDPLATSDIDLNCANLNQDPNQCSEEPKTTFEQCPRRQAPVHNPIILHIIFILLFVYVVINFIAHLRFLGVDRKP